MLVCFVDKYLQPSRILSIVLFCSKTLMVVILQHQNRSLVASENFVKHK